MILLMMERRDQGKSSLPVQTSIQVAAAATVPTPVTLISRSVFQSFCSYTGFTGLVFRSTSTAAATTEETISVAIETTKSTGIPIKATPITKTPIPITTQTQIQTDSIHFRWIQTELATRFYFILVLVSYINYFVRRNLEKWMVHLLTLTSLPSAEMLNCLMLSSTTQTWPFKLNLKNLEKWMDQFLIIILLPGIYWVLFITTQICPFYLDLCTCKVDLVVMVGFSELRRDLSVIGDSLRLCCDLRNLSSNNHVSTFL